MCLLTVRQRAWAFLLVLVCLAAQFNFCACCASLTDQDNCTHFCPFCSTAATAIATDPPLLQETTAVTRLEIPKPDLLSMTEIALIVSSRAPPTL